MSFKNNPRLSESLDGDINEPTENLQHLLQPSQSVASTTRELPGAHLGIMNMFEDSNDSASQPVVSSRVISPQDLIEEKRLERESERLEKNLLESELSQNNGENLLEIISPDDLIARNRKAKAEAEANRVEEDKKDIRFEEQAKTSSAPQSGITAEKDPALKAELRNTSVSSQADREKLDDMNAEIIHAYYHPIGRDFSTTEAKALKNLMSPTSDEHVSAELPGAHLRIMNSDETMVTVNINQFRIAHLRKNAAEDAQVTEMSIGNDPKQVTSARYLNTRLTYNVKPTPPPLVTPARGSNESATQPVSEVTAETQPAPNATPRHHDISGKAKSIHFDIYEFWSTRDTYGADFILSQGCLLFFMFFFFLICKFLIFLLNIN